jgi:predicted phage terminase large subunit-like protein
MVDFTQQEAEEIKEAAHAALAKQDLLAFCTYIHPGFETPEHLRVLAYYLQEVEAGRIRRLLITMPPRHGKSEMAHGKFPAWCLGRDRNRTIISASYSAELAEKFSEQNRDTISKNSKYHKVFPGVAVSPKTRKRERWALQGQVETYRAAGIAGGISGFGAWLLLVDDPIKDWKQAMSATWREAVWNWYLTTSRTRLTQDGRIVVIMTRWHDDDLAGKILASDEADEYTVLHLTGLSYGTEKDYKHLSAEEKERALEGVPKSCFPDPLKRPLDIALWPERFDQNFLLTTRAIMGYHFFALYQGHPTDPKGQMFQREWFRLITPDTLAKLNIDPKKAYRSYDLAWSASQAADETVGLKGQLIELYDDPLDEEDQKVRDLYGGIPPAILLLQDGQSWQQEWDETAELIIQIAKEDGADIPLLVEAVASQNKGFKSLQRRRALWKHTVYATIPDGDKVVRCKNSLYVGRAGCIFILTQEAGVLPDWAKRFLLQLAAFPTASNDDWVDALTQLVEWLYDDIEKLMGDAEVVRWITPFSEPEVPKEAVVANSPDMWMFRADSGDPFGGMRDQLAWMVDDEEN